MPNLETEQQLFSKIEKTGPVDSNPPKYTLPQLYALHREIYFNKLDEADKRFFLANQLRDDCGFVNRLIKEATRAAEDQFDKQSLDKS